MPFSALFQLANRQVSIQALGRLLIQVSYGLISFYIPILFVNEMGFSATSVGFAGAGDQHHSALFH